MRRWFIRAARTFDPELTAILEAQTGWFDRVAGDQGSQGLRDVVTHYRGTHQIVIQGGVPPLEALRPMLVGDTRVVCRDEMAELLQCSRGLCEFLDATLVHLVEVMRRQLEDPPPPESWLATRCTTLYAFDTQLPPAAWLFPSLGGA